MIRQHFLQQQRLNYNHDRLLQRYQHINTPQISEFRTFGTSSLPGRNYDQYLNTTSSNSGRRDSLVAQSRAGIGVSNETYRWMGNGTSEILPRNITSVMQHTRQQPAALVHAEKFEPVNFYEHPIFGPTPAYIRPVFNERQPQEKTNDNDSNKDDSDSEEDDDVRSHKSGNTASKIDHKEDNRRSSVIIKTDDEDEEESGYIPKGYISYKKWKSKYENLIPVNPLLYNIYTQRPNGSINSYGQLVYGPSNRHRQLAGDDDELTPTLSDIGSVSSETPREPSLASDRRYHRLQPQLFPKPVPPRSLEPIRPGNQSDSSDDESSPPDSPVPYLSRNRPNPITSSSLSTTVPPTPVITPSVPTTVTPSTLTTSIIDTSGTPSTPFTPTNTSNIPSAPPMPASLLPTSTTSSYQTPSNLPRSSPPIAPPMPTSLSTSSSVGAYQTPSNLPRSSPPIAPPMPTSLSTSGSAGAYQTPSTISLPAPSVPSLAGSATKAVTFGGSSAITMANNDVSSSSDSDDDEKQKRRRRKKRQAAAGVDEDSSSDD